MKNAAPFDEGMSTDGISGIKMTKVKKEMLSEHPEIKEGNGV